MTKAIDYQTNIDRLETKYTPVTAFRSKNMPVEKRIGGLLDYGYSVTQVAHMLHISPAQIVQVMRAEGFKQVDELKVIYAARAVAGEKGRL